MSRESFCKNILQKTITENDVPEEYRRLTNDYGVMGGRGHFFYEVGERGTHSPTEREIAQKLSEDDYAVLRTHPRSTIDKRSLSGKIEEFRLEIEVLSKMQRHG